MNWLKHLLCDPDPLVADLLADDLSMIETDIDLDNNDPLDDDELANICNEMEL